MPVIPTLALRKQRHISEPKDNLPALYREFQTSQDYKLRPYIQEKKKEGRKRGRLVLFT